MKAQKEYFDVNVVNETRNQTYKRLAKLGNSVGLDEGKMYDLLEVGDKADKDGGLNIGNKVTDEFKLCVKEARTRSIHVSPTVVFNVSIKANKLDIVLTLVGPDRAKHQLELFS